MEPSIERELKELRGIVEENNRMLKGIRRDAMIKSVVGIVWVIIFLGLPIMMYFMYIEPQLRTLAETTKSLQSGENGEMPEALKGLLDAYLPR